MYTVQMGSPIPETRGRKKGSLDQNSAARQAAISKGAALVATGASYAEAARAVQCEYLLCTVESMARLISQSAKSAEYNEQNMMK